MTSMYDVLRASKGLPVDDIFAELWGRKLSGDYTIDVYTGTLPATLTGTKAGYLHKYKIYGNLSQHGTPTPENPIVPQECGERTANLWDENYNQDIEKDQIIYVELQVGNGAFTCSTTAPKWEIYPSQYDSLNARFIFLLAGRQSSGAGNTANGVSYGQPRTVNAIDGYITIAYRWSTSTNPQAQPETVKPWEYRTVIVKGSTPPESYIPYGYKLPLLSGSTPVDIYLGESQTTRRIKKLVLTGEENWGYNDSNHTAYLTTSGSFLGEGVSVISTHYTAVSNKTSYSQLSDKQCCLRANGNYLWIRDDDYSTAEDFKAYLTEQYANGTPVTVWYVLATPTTGTLNEPLRKIGDYADTIDSTQTSAQIPTTAGSTTISWGGQGLAPSEVELTYERK